MISFVVGAFLLGFAIAVLLGLFRIVSEAFHDSAYLGVLVLLFPPALVVFALARYKMCKEGVHRALVGGAGVALVWVYGVPLVYSSGEAKRIQGAISSAEEARDAPNACPSESPNDEGFAKFCCARDGWRVVGRGGCTAVYRPTSACTKERRGTLEQTVCGTVGRLGRNE